MQIMNARGMNYEQEIERMNKLSMMRDPTKKACKVCKEEREARRGGEEGRNGSVDALAFRNTSNPCIQFSFSIV